MENDEKPVTQGLMECVYRKKFNCCPENAPSADFCPAPTYKPRSLLASSKGSYCAAPLQIAKE